jgi:hypothetical protein
MKSIWNRTLLALSTAGLAANGACIITDAVLDDAVLDCAELTADLRLADRSDPEDDSDDDEVDYILNCDWFVAGDAVIDPGVILHVRDGFTIRVEGESSLSAKGTAEAPILIRGENAVRGAWGGLYFDSVSTENALDHVTIEHGGGVEITSNAYQGSVIVLGGGRLAMTNTTLREGASTGLHVDGQATLTFADNTITAHDGQPIVIAAENLVDLDGASTLTGNDEDVVRILTPATGGVSGTWAKLTVPYLVDPNLGDVLFVGEGSRIEVEAGTELRFRANAGLTVEGNADVFIAAGTAEAPIRFVGTAAGVGTWRGIYVGSGSTENLIDHAVIDGGGSDSFNSNDNRGGIVVFAEGALTLRNSTVSNTPGCGVSAEYENAAFTDGGGNTFTGVVTDVCRPAAE